MVPEQQQAGRRDTRGASRSEVADTKLQLSGTARAERVEKHLGRAAVRHLGAARHERVMQRQTTELPDRERVRVETADCKVG